MSPITKDVLETLKRQVSVATFGEPILLQIAKEIEEQIATFKLDPRWKNYFEVTVYDGEEIHVTIGQRDIQFDKRGNRIGSGYLFMAVDEPWKN